MDMLLDGLKKAGFSVDEIEKIFYKNVLRVYDEVLGCNLEILCYDVLNY